MKQSNDIEMDNNLIGSLLSASIKTLDTSVASALEDPHAKTHLDLTIRVLRMLSAHFSHHVDSIKDFEKDVKTTFPEMNIDGAGYESLESSLLKNNQLLEIIADQIPSLIDHGKDNHANAKLNDLIKCKEHYLASLDPDILHGSAMVFRGGTIDRSNNKAERPVVDTARLESYLKNRFENYPDLSVTRCQMIVGGFSKTTVMFDVCWTKNAEPERMFMRKDLPVLFMDKTVHNEYPLLESLYKAGLSVPEPYWLESDAGIFDGAFYVMKAIPGSSDVSSWSEHAPSVSEQLAKILATLHSYDAGQVLDSFAIENAGIAMEKEIEFWRKLYARRRSKRHPLIELVLAWLDRNIPEELYSRPARIVHGDVGFHNLMVDNGKVTALLDWEFAHAGDPSEDLLYIKPFVEQFGLWDEFYKSYQAAGGISASTECENFVKVWSYARNAIGTIDARYLFKHHLNDELKLAVAGLVFGPYLELDASKLVLSLLKA